MRPQFQSAFDGRSVFVTGHTGFKGSWLCMWLKRLGASITGYALEPPTTPSNFSVCKIGDLLDTHHLADIRDEKFLHRSLLNAEPDVIFHLAAQSVVREGYRNPKETFEVNSIGVANLLDGVRLLSKPCVVVVVTSDKCYENREQVWGYRESDPLGDHDPYGGSKGAAEIVVRTYRHSYFPPERVAEHGVKLASARAGNVIGGGDWTHDALIVDVVDALVKTKPVELRSPDAYRPWQHVLQALSGYLTLAARLTLSDDCKYCSGWNIGPKPGNEIPVRDVVELFMKEWGGGEWIDCSSPNAPREAGILRLSIDKALWELGWNPGWETTEALRRTAYWYKRYYENSSNMLEISLAQIADYEEQFFEDPEASHKPHAPEENLHNALDSIS